MAKQADNLETLILEALERALADPAPRKLHGTKASPGIFLSSSAAAKAASQRCLEEQLLEPRGEVKTRGARTVLYGLAPAGIRYLLEHDPVQGLLTATRTGVDSLAGSARECQRSLGQILDQLGRFDDIVQRAAERLKPPDLGRLLERPQPAPPATQPARPAAEVQPQLRPALRSLVQQHQRRSPLQPLELPQLFRAARSEHPALTIGQFHDTLRQMSQAKEVRLSPYTQAMYQLAEPEVAMIVGREVMYYVHGS